MKDFKTGAVDEKERKLNEGNRGISWKLRQRTSGYSTDDRRETGRPKHLDWNQKNLDL